MSAVFLFNFPLDRRRTHLRLQALENTAAEFPYGHKCLKQCRHAVAKSAAGPASAPLLRHCRGRSTGGPQWAPEKREKKTSNETRRKSGVFASDHERPGRRSLAPITLWKMPDQTVCADFSEPESQRGPAEVKPAWALSDRLKEGEKRKIMCPAIKKFPFLRKKKKVLLGFYHSGKWLSRFLIGFFSPL